VDPTAPAVDVWAFTATEHDLQSTAPSALSLKESAAQALQGLDPVWLLNFPTPHGRQPPAAPPPADVGLLSCPGEHPQPSAAEVGLRKFNYLKVTTQV
jgi:hypothetical protein